MKFSSIALKLIKSIKKSINNPNQGCVFVYSNLFLNNLKTIFVYIQIVLIKEKTGCSKKPFNDKYSCLSPSFENN